MYVRTLVPMHLGDGSMGWVDASSAASGGAPVASKQERERGLGIRPAQVVQARRFIPTSFLFRIAGLRALCPSRYQPSDVPVGPRCLVRPFTRSSTRNVLPAHRRLAEVSLSQVGPYWFRNTFPNIHLCPTPNIDEATETKYGSERFRSPYWFRRLQRGHANK